MSDPFEDTLEFIQARMAFGAALKSAVLAERERCAKIAETQKMDAAATEADPGAAGYNQACDDIAATIRKGE